MKCNAFLRQCSPVAVAANLHAKKVLEFAVKNLALGLADGLASADCVFILSVM